MTAFLSSAFIFTNASINVSAVLSSDPIIARLELDNIDVILASHYFLASDDDMNFWYDDLSEVEIVPLYDIEGDISSYYVELPNSVGYAVINNNVENQTAIEFGAGSNPQIRAIMENTIEPHIIYNSPVSLYNMGDVSAYSSISDAPDIYENYPDLRESNVALANVISQQRVLLENTIVTHGDGDYGFIDFSNMPSGKYDSACVSNLSGVEWVSTGETAGSGVDNHCGAVAVTNLALFFAMRGKSNLIQGKRDPSGQYRMDTFNAVHDIVGNGPKMTIADDAVKYFKDCGYTLNYYTDRNVFLNDRIAAEIAAINHNRPCGILLEDALFSWHWVIGVGYRIYNDNNTYFQIVDGWSKNDSHYYKPGYGSTWVSMTEYWVN